MSCISRACSSLVRQPYYAPNCIILKISGLESILAREKGRWDGRIFYIDEYALIFLFSRCARCAQKRDCWEHELCILQGLIIQQPVQLCPLCRGVAVFVLNGYAVDGKSDFILEPGFHPVGVHVVAAGQQLHHSKILLDLIFWCAATQTNAVKPVRIGRFYLSESKCTVSARILHGFKTCKRCFSLQNLTKDAEITG